MPIPHDNESSTPEPTTATHPDTGQTMPIPHDNESSTPEPTTATVPGKRYLQQDDTTPECKALMSSLPKDKGWVVTNLYQYQGFWHTPRQLQGVLTFQKNFQARESDILLVTTPKSGTTWLKAMSYALVNRKHKPPSSKSHPLTTNNPHDLVPFLELKVYVDNQVPELSSLPDPRLFCTHLPLGSLPESVMESATKIVYLCRNPKDTFVSLWHFTNKLRPKEIEKLSLDDAIDRFCRGVSLYGPYWDHVVGYRKASLEKPETVLFLKYEELKEQAAMVLNKLAYFLGCPFTEEELQEKGTGNVAEDILKLCSFDNLSNLEVNKNGKLSSGEENKAFFRKGATGDSANYLVPDMIARLDEMTEQKFSGLGLKF